MLGVDIAESVFEPRAGGRVFDRGVDGSECQWGRVLAYEPPDRILFTWDINPTWQIEADLSKSSKVEVRFVADGPDRTRVELEHRQLDRHGDGLEGMLEGVRRRPGVAAVPRALRGGGRGLGLSCPENGGKDGPFGVLLRTG